MIANRLSGLSDRRIWIPALVLAVVAVAAVLFHFLGGKETASQRPAVMVMSSIPLQWGTASMADVASGKAEPAPVYQKLAADNKVTLLDDLQKMGEPGVTPLLLIQPRALAPAELVQLDTWVRKGGAVIIFADPALDWPSDLPLGDQRRPLFTSLLNPLFRHWGLELALSTEEEESEAMIAVGAYSLSMKSPGIFIPVSSKKATAKCRVRKDERMAACTVGKGQALLIADADVLEEAQWTGGVMTSGTMAWLQDLIVAAQHKRPIPPALWEIQGN
jgi:hypothetical protein